MRIIALGAASLATAMLASTASAVILYRAGLSPTGVPPNSTAPTGTLSTSGWQYQMKFGEYLGTPVGPNTFVTANHIAPGIGSTFVWNSETYTVTSGSNINDIAIRRVNKIFPSWAPLYDETVDGSLLGKELVVFGRGIGRGAEVHLATAPRPGESTLRGWKWDGTAFGDTDTQTWGMNIVDDFYSDSGPNPKKYIIFDFDRNGLAEEALLSYGDSGGAVFVQGTGGIWKLVATNTGAESAGPDSGFRLTANGPTFEATLFDKGNMYQDQPSPDPDYFNPDEIDDIPSIAYSSNISAYLSSFSSYLPKPGDANLDGKVTTRDFNLFAGHFGASSFNWADGDFNHDGVVNSTDFTLFAANYGGTGNAFQAPAAPGAVVPEPGHAVVLALVSLMNLRRRQTLPNP